MFIQDYLAETNPPQWLDEWADNPASFNSRELVQKFLSSRTVFYSGSDVDGHPVSVINRSHSVHCYVYVDYGLSRDSLTAALETEGFRGYTLGCHAELTASDFGPWSPTLTPTELGIAPRNGPIGPSGAFGFIQLFERSSGFDDSHGARRFAILFLLADGHAAFDALYCQNNGAAPPFCVVLQDHGFGGNWAPFGNDGPMHRIAKAAGVFPDYLLVASNTGAWDGYGRCETSTGHPVEGTAVGPRGRFRFLWQWQERAASA